MCIYFIGAAAWLWENFYLVTEVFDFEEFSWKPSDWMMENHWELLKYNFHCFVWFLPIGLAIFSLSLICDWINVKYLVKASSNSLPLLLEAAENTGVMNIPTYYHVTPVIDTNFKFLIHSRPALFFNEESGYFLGESALSCGKQVFLIDHHMGSQQVQLLHKCVSLHRAFSSPEIF